MRLRTAWLSAPLRRPGWLGVLVLVLAGLGLACAWGGRHLWARFHYRAALADLARYRPAEACPHLEKCLTVWRDDGATHLLAAQASRQAGDFDAAERHLEAHARLHAAVSEERALEWAMLRAQNGDLETVEEPLLARVLNDDAKSPLILEALVEGNLRMYRFTA